MRHQQKLNQWQKIPCHGRCMAALLLMAWLSVVVHAAPGDLDPSFGNGGKVVTPVGDGSIRAIAIQSDGKIVAVGDGGIVFRDGLHGDFAITRYNIDGSLDVSFGSDGIVVTSIRDGYDGANAVAIQSDGKIVAGGSCRSLNFDTDFALVRYNTNGSLDNSFGTGGIVVTSIGYSYDIANALAIQSDGKIVAAGYIGVGWDYDENIALARYNVNGSLDTSFGNGGIIANRNSFDNDPANAVAIQSNGKIVAAGYRNGGFGLTRYNTNGSIDTSFGTDGKVDTFFGGVLSQAYAVAIQTDGKIVATGNSYSGIYPDFINNFALARYTSNGSLDTSFGTGGKVLTLSGGSSDSPHGAAIQSDGKIVVAGYDLIGSNQVFAVARYETGGTLDTSFGSGGKVLTSIDTDAGAYAVAIQPDGKIVAAGFNYNDPNGNFALVRYLGETVAYEGDVAPRNGGDGVVNALDVVQMRRFAAGLDTPDPASNEFQRADCSPRATFGDGIIDATDVLQARRYAAGLDPLTPAAGPAIAADHVTTSSFGYYTFADVRTGESYLLRVASRRYRFTSLEIINANENITDADFVGLE